ncbi:uncharacterized protein LOC131658569 [Vicia villosa]|uniref:uncharacterized protein LOC131658569 n=1 Tax=Vicia villosa TaxID=3911 RepID=UPI00273AAACF|nr:uncharacterized protein LOC131658569 [Vicia villosa]
MSQQSDSSSPKKLSSISDLDSVSMAELVNPNQVLDVSPLRMVTIEDLNVKKPRTPHARRPKETVLGTNVVNLDDYSDNDLVASINPSIAKRLMTRKKEGRLLSKALPRGKLFLKKKPTSIKLAARFPDVPIDNISFHYASSVNRWKYVYQKRLALERELAQNSLECKDIMELIHDAGLMKTVARFSKCYEILVKEFIVNLSEECADGKSKEFRKVKSWPLKGKLSASKLSMKYAMLHKIGAANWVPTNHKSTIATILGRFIYVVGTKSKFNYGSYIFEKTMKHAGSFSVKGPKAFPSLICGITLNHYPGILVENDSVCKRESDFSFPYKLFQGTHVPDIVMTSAGTSKERTPAGKAAVIAMLKETCKELETRKLTLENLSAFLKWMKVMSLLDLRKEQGFDREEFSVLRLCALGLFVLSVSCEPSNCHFDNCIGVGCIELLLVVSLKAFK